MNAPAHKFLRTPLAVLGLLLLASLAAWGAAPTNVSLNPDAGSSSVTVAQTLTAVYDDQDGAGNIADAYILVNAVASTDSALCGWYDSAANKLYLADDTGAAWIGGYTPGSANTIPNSQGSLDCSQTTVSRTATGLTVNWSLTPGAVWAGTTKNVYLRVVDQSDADSNWKPFGTWVIKAPELTVTGTSTAPALALRGEGDICMERLRLTADVLSVSVTTVKVRDIGSIPHSQISLRVYRDANGNGLYNAGTDTDITPAAPGFDTGTKTWTFTFATPVNVAAGTPVNLFLVAAIGTDRSAVTGTVNLTLASKAEVTVTTPNTVAATNFPITSGTLSVDDVAPVATANSYSTDEDTPLVVPAPGPLSDDTDAEADPLTMQQVTDPWFGTVAANEDGSFTYTPPAGWHGTETFTYKASDGFKNSDSALLTVTVNAVNDAPVATDDAYSTSEDIPLVIGAPGVLSNDTDEDSVTLTALKVADPAHGALTLNANGSFTYTPEADWSGTDTFTYKANDGTADSNTATVTITVTAANDAPAAVNDAYSTNEDTELAVAAPGVLANDTDAEGNALTAVLAAGPAHGTVMLNPDGSFTYTPAVDWNGADTFTYRANDGTASGSPATVTITVNPVPDAPVATNDVYATAEETALTGAVPGVLGNDTDADGNGLTAALAAGPTHGTLTLNPDGSFTYTPSADWTGLDTFTYKANDGTADSNTATVRITTTGVNDPPAAANDSYATSEDTALTVVAPGVLGNDTDTEGGALTAAVAAGPAHGTLTLNANGSFTYTPEANWNGTDTFTYRANDGTANSNTATVTITVNPINDRPAAANNSYATAEETELTVAAPGVLGNDTDLEGNALTAVLVAGPAHGTLVLNPDGSFTYTPETDWTGTDTFTYKANDGALDSTTATVSINVGGSNDPPTAPAASYTTNEDTALTVAAPGVLGNDSDPDGDAITTVLVAGPARGTLTLNANGSFTYTPEANWSGADSFTYQANDGAAYSDVVTVSITVNPVSDRPIAAADSYSTSEDTTLTIAAPGVLDNDTDLEGDALTAVLVAAPTRGTLTLNSNGSFTYRPVANWNGVDTFTYKANDGTADSATATVHIAVSAANDAPSAAGESYTTGEDIALTVAAPGVLGNDTDIDGNALTAVLVDGPAHGTLALSARGSFTYTPAGDWSGTDTFTYKANDGTTESSPVTVTIVVVATDDPPAAGNDSYATDEDTALTVPAPGVLANDTDAEGDAFAAVLVAGPAHGTVALNPDGAFTYTPAADWNGTDTFTYKANAGGVDGNVATVSITVNATSDAPVAVSDSYATDEDTALTVAAPGVLGNDTDVDNGVLTVALVAGPTHGALTLNPDGSFTYTPAADWSGTDTFTYTANDGTTDSGIATVTLTVRPTNDAPVAADDSYTTNEDALLTVATPGVLGNDTDLEGGTLKAVLEAGPAHGTVSVNGSGFFVYRPAANWNGTDTFTYKVRDGAVYSNAATVTITVNPMNDRPTAAPDSYAVDEDTTLTVAASGVLGNDTDPEGDALSALPVTAPSRGTLTLNADGSFTYTPTANWSGTDFFTYQASDGPTRSSLTRVNVIVRGTADLSFVAANSASVTGGDATVGKIALTGPAPVGGLAISLSSGNPVVTVPAGVTVAAGETRATFPITTSVVAADTPVIITATGAGYAKSMTLTVKAVSVRQLVVAPAAVNGGGNAGGSLVLNRPAPAGGLVVSLGSSDAAVVVPTSVTVAAGTTTAVFSITTVPVGVNTPVVVTATCGGVGRTATITVKAPTPYLLMVSPASITGGYTALGSRVLLNAPAPAGGLVVALESSDPAVASVPATVTVPAGDTRGNFTISTTPVSAATAVLIQATTGGVSRMGMLTVKPPATP